jgi:predicted Zn-dependent protease
MSRYRIKQNFLIKQALPLQVTKKVNRQSIYPCYLGISFIGNISQTILKKIKFYLDQIFDSFFFDIIFMGEKKLDPSVFDLNIKEEFNLLDSTSKRVFLQPTNKFYSIIKNQMRENNLTLGIGLTNLPIYSSCDEKILFLFGEAHFRHRCAIVSIFNLSDVLKSGISLSRIIKETIHEVGHLILGPEHCLGDYCVMRFSANIIEIDRKSFHLCEKCKLKLGEIRVLENF